MTGTRSEPASASPAITGHRAVFSDRPVEAKHVLVHGVLGAVGSLAVQLARWGVGSGDRTRAPHHRHRQGGPRSYICCRSDQPGAAA